MQLRGAYETRKAKSIHTKTVCTRTAELIYTQYGDMLISCAPDCHLSAEQMQTPAYSKPAAAAGAAAAAAADKRASSAH